MPSFQYREILQKHIPYYRSLSESERPAFEKRVDDFIQLKEFIPRGELKEVSVEMKVLASVSATIVTKGLPGIALSHFDKILFYPDEFFSNHSDSYQKFEINAKHGLIVFSWKHLAHGFLIPDDGINPGIFAMAQALCYQNKTENIDSEFFDSMALQEWMPLADKAFLQIKNQSDYFMNGDHELNREDFFPMAVVLFFEKPDSFIAQYPYLFRALEKLLNLKN